MSHVESDAAMRLSPAEFDAEMTALEGRAQENLDGARRSLNKIAEVDETARRCGMTREELDRRVAANLAGPPPSLSDLRDLLGPMFGVHVSARPDEGGAAA
jgi:hypothetical protein